LNAPRIVYDRRVTEAGSHTGVAAIGSGLLTGLRTLAACGDIELFEAGTGQTPQSGETTVLKLPARGFMQWHLPLAASRVRADALIIPRQTVPPVSSVPAVPLFHDVGFSRVPDIYPSARSIKLTSRIAGHARRALAVSPYTVDEMRALGLRTHATALPIQAIHPFTWAPGEGNRYLLCVAVQDVHKNLARLVRAWGKAALNDVRLVICGRNGSDSSNIADAVASLPQSSSVQFVSNLSDGEYKRLMENAWGYVQPSLYEGLCIPALDLAAAGMPLVVSSYSNLGQVFQDAPAPQTFDPLDEEDIAASLRALAYDAAFRTASAEFNKRKVSLTDWTSVARRSIEGAVS
jgi:glycosyltransferase involved in cell wall biosynthesis